MTIAHERLDPDSDGRLRGLLRAGDPRGEVRMAWHSKEVTRSIYDIDDADTATVFVAQLGIDLQDDSCPPEVQRLGRMIVRWQSPDRRLASLPAHERADRSDQPPRQAGQVVAFGMTNWINYRTRALLYAGRHNWALLNP